MREFAAISVEELDAYDDVNRFRGKIVVGYADAGLDDPIIDESADIERYGEDCKELLGPDQTNGFKDVVEMMRYMADKAELPKPVPVDGGGGVRELAYA